MVEVGYRRPGQPGSATPILIASPARDPAVLLAKLEAVVGPVVHERFEVVPDAEPSPPEPPAPGAGAHRERSPNAGPDVMELVDALEAEGADDLPFEVVQPPPGLLRLLAARAGGKPAVRAVVLAVVPDPEEAAVEWAARAGAFTRHVMGFSALGAEGAA